MSKHSSRERLSLRKVCTTRWWIVGNAPGVYRVRFACTRKGWFVMVYNRLGRCGDVVGGAMKGLDRFLLVWVFDVNAIGDSSER